MEPQPQLVIVRRNSGELRLIIPLYICLETFHLVPLKRMDIFLYRNISLVAVSITLESGILSFVQQTLAHDTFQCNSNKMKVQALPIAANDPSEKTEYVVGSYMLIHNERGVLFDGKV